MRKWLLPYVNDTCIFYKDKDLIFAKVFQIRRSKVFVLLGFISFICEINGRI